MGPDLEEGTKEVDNEHLEGSVHVSKRWSSLAS